MSEIDKENNTRPGEDKEDINQPKDEPMDQDVDLHSDNPPIEPDEEQKPKEEHEEEEEEEEDEEEGEGGSGETRCVCGSTDEESYGFMIQCETCGCWQHGVCVGLVDEKYAPDTYYCEQCRPELHPIVLPNRPGRKPSRHNQQKKELKQKSPVSSSRRRSSSSNDGQERVRSPKRRSTLNSRDAAYDDAIAASLLSVQNDNLRAQIAEREKQRWVQYGGQVTPSQNDDENGNIEQSEEQPVAEDNDGDKVPENEREQEQEQEREPSREKHIDGEADYKPRSRSDPRAAAPRGRGGKRKDNGRNSAAAKARNKEKSIVNDDEEKTDSNRRSGSPNSAPADERERAPSRGYKKRRRETDESNNEESGFTPPANANGPRRAATSSRKDKNLQSPHKRKTVAREKDKKNSYDDESSLTWGMPDHLQHLSHMLPSETPEMLALRIPHGDTIDIVREMPTKVKFPTKRMPIGEMKRRVRSVLEYVGRVQIEAADRPTPERKSESPAESIQMLDNITRELIRFNERFSTNTKRREEEEE